MAGPYRKYYYLDIYIGNLQNWSAPINIASQLYVWPVVAIQFYDCPTAAVWQKYRFTPRNVSPLKISNRCTTHFAASLLSHYYLATPD